MQGRLTREDGVCKGVLAGIHPEELSVKWSNMGKEALHLGGAWWSANNPSMVAAGAEGIMVKNIGFVWAQAKGCSRDEYIYTLAKYII